MFQRNTDWFYIVDAAWVVLTDGVEVTQKVANDENRQDQV